MDDLLSGTLVVALEQAVAGPLASRKLAEAGARVLKIERDTGDFARGYDQAVLGQSSYFVWLNHGKESVALDIGDPEDAALLRRVLARADVYLQNLAPGAAARAGFGSEELCRRHPRLVACDISGYGETGPFAEMKAYDNLVQGEAGLLAVTGTGDEPARVGISVCDIAAGMHAYAAILEALLRRERTGLGSRLRVSLFDCLADWMSVPLLHQEYGGRAPARSGAHHPSIAPYGPYSTGDGRTLLLCVQNEREWARFCATVLRRPEMAEHEDFRSNHLRVKHRDRLDAALHEVLVELTAEALAERLREADIAYGRLNSVAEFAAHPQLRRRSVQTPAGEISLPAHPVRTGGAAAAGAPRVPAIGEHTAAVRAEFASD